MPKTTVRAGSNIAFIKYWGVADSQLHLPLNSSISMTLAEAFTTTTVEWTSHVQGVEDHIELDGVRLDKEQSKRIVKHLDLIRKLAGSQKRAKVVSYNNFPAASGIASSASGFAALSIAGCRALGLQLGAEDFSRLARRGSGSAARSVFAGFVEWAKGKDDRSSVAYQLYPPSHWELHDIVVVVSREAKRTSSVSGHQLAHTSPLLQGRLASLPQALTEVREAIKNRELSRLGPVIEMDALAMHAVMMTSIPSLFYWHGPTVELIQQVIQWRREGIEVYFTIDAGPNVHLICEPEATVKLVPQIQALSCVEQVLVSGPGAAPAVSEEHLF